MKTWHLALVQLWVVLFVPAWAFVLVFSPMVLTPEPAWAAFFFMVSPPFIALFCSVAMWVAKSKGSTRWQQTMATALIIIPIISVIIPYLILE